MLATLLAATLAAACAAPAQDPPTELWVDPARGKDRAPGDQRRPLQTLAAAIARLPDPLAQSATIHLAAGAHELAGDSDITLALMRRMRPGVAVRIAGARGGEPSVLAWPAHTLVIATEGTWQLENVQIGAFATSQRRGVEVIGPGHVELRDVTFRLRSHSDAAIWARYGGRATLHGRIAVNEHLHDAAEDETFSGLLATEHGVIEWGDRDDSSLELGNGSLSVRTYGMIRLGCARARVTCWTKSNNLTVNNGGRIDLLNTPIVLRAHLRNNTPIGLEHDGHILAEDAKITISGPNDSAIALQKASTLTCNDIALDGEFEYAIWASSGSMFVGRFLTDIHKVEASTGAGIHIEKVAGEVLGPVTAKSGGVVSLPDRVVRE
jgi:hypothetical protein